MQDATLVSELNCYETMWLNATTPANKEAKWKAIVTATECLPSHPEGYDGPCWCDDCKPDWLDA